MHRARRPTTVGTKTGRVEHKSKELPKGPAHRADESTAMNHEVSQSIEIESRADVQALLARLRLGPVAGLDAPETPELPSNVASSHEPTRSQTFAVIDEEEELRAHERRLEAEYQTLARRKQGLAIRRLESSLRQAMEVDLRSRRAATRESFERRERDLNDQATAEIEDLVSLKDDLSGKIEELCSLYEIVVAQEDDVRRRFDEESQRLRAEAEGCVRAIEQAAEIAIKERLDKESALLGQHLG